MSVITIRELAAADQHALAFMFSHLSARSRYQRYFTTKHALVAADLRPV